MASDDLSPVEALKRDACFFPPYPPVKDDINQPYIPVTSNMCENIAVNPAKCPKRSIP
jgi:hypothetical protein